MATPLNILMAEDSQADAELLLEELRHAGFEPRWTLVETEAAFVAGLKTLPDIILSDYSMPRFTGLRAAQLVQASGLDIPFILISGTVGEEIAVEAMKQGATDYLMKDRIVRLGPAVRRALDEKRLRDERKLTVQSLRDSEASMAAAQRIAHFGNWELDLTAPAATADFAVSPVRWSDEMCRIAGYEPGTFEVTNDLFFRLVPAEEHDLIRQAMATAIRERRPYSLVHRLRRPTGEERVVHESAEIFFEERSGRPLKMIGTCQDITERTQAEAAVLELQALYLSLVEKLPAGIFRKDAAGRYLFVNAWFCQLKGIRPEAMLGKTPQELALHELSTLRPDERANAREAKLASQGEDNHRLIMTTGQTVETEEEYPGPDGKPRQLHVVKVPVFDAKGKIIGTQGMLFDVTERRKLEEQFRQSQKMEAIGKLAGGVAHDFNNILAVIQLQAGLLRTAPDVSPPQLDHAVEIEKAAQRAAGLTRQLLLFSRKQNPQPRDLNLNDIIAGITKMLQRLLGEDIRMQFTYAPRPLMIHADASMMDQILLNLAVNSRDAMPHGGQLTIETSAVELDEHAPRQSPQARPGAFVCLSVSDNGCGIPPENLPKIFDPFFTTKEVGKGTGLGLATVFGVVQQHHGWINVYSEVGHGTTVRVYLPRLDRTSDPKPAGISVPPVRGGHETILLVEDDHALRGALDIVLSRLGYRVLKAATGAEALAVWEQHRDTIQLLLTDLVMPDGMNGKELARLLLQKRPGLKVIYASGYSADIASKDLVLEEGVNFLIKPFESHKLAQTIRARLDAPA